MRITHVIRGDDHLTNTPLQILVYEALGHPVPVFAHLSMIWGADGKKLSKRHGATSVEAFHDEGFLPEALLNYLALLGWSLDGETTVFSSEVLKTHFSLDRISKSPAIFDFEKLEWMNGVYIREMGPEAFVGADVPLARGGGACLRGRPRDPARVASGARSARLGAHQAHDRDRADGAVPVRRGHRHRSGGGREASWRRRARDARWTPSTTLLASLDEWTSAAIEEALRTVPEALGMKPKAVFQAARVAVAGSTVSLPLFESIALLGREAALARLEAARSIATP